MSAKLFSIIALGCLVVGCLATAPPITTPPPATVTQPTPEEPTYRFDSPIDPSDLLEWTVISVEPLGYTNLGMLIDIYATNPDESNEYHYVNMVATQDGILSYGLLSATGCLSVYNLDMVNGGAYNFLPCNREHRETYEQFKEGMERVFGIPVVIPGEV